MSDPKPTGDLPLIEEANREAWKRSLFWKNDHPSDNSRGRNAPAIPTTYAELITGARGALEQSRAIGRIAEERLREEGAVAGAAADAVRAEIRPFMVNAMLGVIRADSQRARCEFRHWREYVAHFQSKAEPLPKMGGIVAGIIESKARQ